MTTAGKPEKGALRRTRYAQRIRVAVTALDKLVAEYDYLRSVANRAKPGTATKELENVITAIRQARTSIQEKNQKKRR